MSNQSSSRAKSEITYGYGRTLDLAFDQAVEHAREALKAEGFGVLSEIDLKEKLKQKLGIDFRKYVILGACNPALAYETLREEVDIGLLLPCNVIVYELDGKTVVSAVDAAKVLSIVGNPKLESTASKVNELLHTVIDSL